MLRLFLSIFFIIVAVQSVVGAEAGQLLLNLKFFMSKHEVKDHLKAFIGYKVDARDPNKMTFLIPDTLIKNKNLDVFKVLFQQFGGSHYWNIRNEKRVL